MPGETTLAELHAVVQTVFGWGGGEHLHRFVIHGTEYGISYVGGQGFRHDARDVRLGELGYAWVPPPRKVPLSEWSADPAHGRW